MHSRTSRSSHNYIRLHSANIEIESNRSKNLYRWKTGLICINVFMFHLSAARKEIHTKKVHFIEKKSLVNAESFGFFGFIIESSVVLQAANGVGTWFTFDECLRPSASAGDRIWFTFYECYIWNHLLCVVDTASGWISCLAFSARYWLNNL